MIKRLRTFFIFFIITAVITCKTAIDSIISIRHSWDIICGNSEFAVSDTSMCIFLANMIVLAVWLSVAERSIKKEK